MRLNSTPKQVSRLSLTPLIDVVFLLLIFFILASTFMRFTSVPISSASRGSGTPGQHEIALVRLQADEGGLTVNGKHVTLSELQTTISGLEQKGVSHAVVQPVGNADVQTLVSVLELLKKSNLKNVVVSK